ncbi:FCD domain-containing protein [Caballeronia sp. SEWSISQ10-4 2]|uniref:FadR/GntR family transcriptional regulator n=1 Tax=Caballeronia sp. SEWSISQ10-4 2 TaxID=2937438 RepID=UPI00264EC4CE|nr:FCD domain-containing protein [Caballeronia sp. SEWSISQ10-4 2]MDN7180365.1 FCD domain-containing protein [Caballeronia sp. SEWSISQ10-4 2]
MKNDVNVEMVRSHLLDTGATAGAKLPTERVLAEQLGVSRNVIRKALSLMEIEGRVMRKVGSGTYLVKQTAGGAAERAGPTRAQAEALDVSPKQIVEARFAFEPNLASLAAMNCTTLDLERLGECARRYHRADNFDAYEAADEGFHRAIALATHNPLLISAYEDFMTADAQAEWGSIRQRFLTAERRVASRKEHDKILAAIRSRDSAAAFGAAREHLQYITSALLHT